ncbi:MAG: glycosyltransferase, partial [Tannerellaceae bacterium]|nr:glycosyltransferase [Tannerellaceae bacterium]
FIYNRKAAALLDRVIRAFHPEIAHIHLMFNSLSASILPVIRRHSLPVVMSVHDYRLICPAYLLMDGKGELCSRCKGGKYYNCVMQRCSGGSLANSVMLTADSYFRSRFIRPADYVDRFIFVSRFARDKHIEFDRAYASRSTVLSNFTTLTAGAKYKKGDYILYLGRISREKGIATLIQAVSGTGIHLKVVGTGPLTGSLQSLNTPGVEFTGFKSGDDLYDTIRQARFTVVPSEWYENNPMSVIESMALGTPVIGSRIGGIPELIEENLTGYLFDMGSVDSLRKILFRALSMDETAYLSMRAAARAFARERFAVEPYHKRLIAVYNRVIQNHNI